MITAIKTGHSAITLDIGIISDTSHVPSFWKFNNSLLDDEAYLKLITDRILIWLTEISYNIDDRVQWDWIKYNIRFNFLVLLLILFYLFIYFFFVFSFSEKLAIQLPL